jgi:hypothetical protein
MPRYYFHQSDGEVTLDNVGTDLPDLSALKTELVRAAGELLKLRSTELLWSEPWKVWATDQANGRGATLATIVITAAVVS